MINIKKHKNFHYFYCYETYDDENTYNISKSLIGNCRADYRLFILFYSNFVYWKQTNNENFNLDTIENVIESGNFIHSFHKCIESDTNHYLRPGYLLKMKKTQERIKKIKNLEL